MISPHARLPSGFDNASRHRFGLGQGCFSATACADCGTIRGAMVRRKEGKETPRSRCAWAARAAELDRDYHDREWGVPVHDDRTLFEFLILEGAQAGLSWTTILKKRENYRRALDGFDARKIARYDGAKKRKLLRDAGIVRNRLKIEATVGNARAFLAVQREFGSFDAYIWRFVGGRPMQNGYRRHKQIPAHTKESDAMSKDLKKRGFRFVGSTICYAFMQAVGMVNDHTTDCFRHRPLAPARRLKARSRPGKV
jgi:DNA-3-methyladenine glycosylase I